MLRFLFLALTCLALASGARGQTCSTEWENPVDGDWDDGTKWTNGIPIANSDACITAPGTYTVTLPSGLPVTNLQTLAVGGTSGTQTLLMDGYMRLTDATIGAGGRMEILPTESSCFFCGLEATGTVLVEGFLSKNSTNGVFLTNTGDVEVASGATLRATNDARLGGPNGTFTVRGTAELADGADIRARMEVLGGTVRVTSGRGDLFNAGGILQNATLDAAAGATLIVQGSYALEGTLSGNPQGGVYLYAGTQTVAASGITLNVTGTGLRIGHPASAQGTTTLTGGPVLNTGRFAFAQSNFFSRIRGTTFTNEGTLELEGDAGLAEAAVVRNRPGGVIRMYETQFFQNPNNSAVRVENAGLLVREDTGPNEASARFVSVTLESLPGSEIRVLGNYLDLATGPNANTLPPGMTLTGNGMLRLFGLPIRSTYSPGTAANPIGMLRPRGSDTFVFAPEAITILDVAANGVSDRIFNVLDFPANITFGGTLRVRVQPGFTPAIGDEWPIVVNQGTTVSGAFGSVEIEGGPPGLSFVMDTSQPGSAFLRAVANVSVSAPLAQAPEGTPMSFVLSHPASPEAFTINVETGGTATLFEDYTLSATRGIVRARPNTTQTTVQVFPRRDANAAEGDEAVTLRVVQGVDASPGAAPEASVIITDGPSNAALALDGVAPARGGMPGTVTPTVFGTGFGADATVRLEGPATVPGSRPFVASSRAGVSATFDLESAPVGTYDVVATSAGQTVTLPGAFTVVGRTDGIPLSGSVSGTPTPRVGRNSTYTVRVHNDGDVDIYDTMVMIRVTGGVALSMTGVRSALGTGSDYMPGLPTGGATIVPVYIYRIPAGATFSANVVIRPSGEFAGQFVGVAAQLFPPNPRATVTYSGTLEDLEADGEAGRWTVWNTVWGAFELHAVTLANGLSPLRAYSRQAFAFKGDDDDCDQSVIPGPAGTDDLVYGNDIREIQRQTDTAGRARNNWNEIEAATPDPENEVAGYLLGSFVTGGLALLEAAGTISIGVGAFPIVAGGVLTMGSIYLFGAALDRIETAYSKVPCAGGRAGGSRDPNDKLGPAGVRAERYYVPDDGPTPYTIRFENEPTASFPAQEVIVVDTLDTAVFDLSTFSFGPITWGETGRLVPPPGAQSFEAEISLAPALAASLLVTASLDANTGRIVWHFVTLDPATNDLPENGLIGFLPPNQAQPEGEGALEFSIKTRDGLPTGTEVSNGAEIVFDVNEPILTPVWTNTVDVTAPVSSVQPLAGTETNPVTLSITGDDGQSGIGAYIVYASRDGGEFEIVGQSTNGTFEFAGEEGSTYGFYSIAADRVQNLEGPKTEAEATTMVAVASDGSPTGPLALTLEAPRPNPARGLVRLRFGLPSAGEANVRVLDALGREVAVLASGEAAPGWHTAEWQPRVASGVYVVELRSGDEVQHQRLTVVR